MSNKPILTQINQTHQLDTSLEADPLRAMDRYLLFQDSFEIYLTPRAPRLALVVERAGGESLAEFPVEISLLRAVQTGFSYQVGNEHGSLNIARNGGAVGLTVQLASKEKLAAKIPLENFSQVLENFGS